MAATRLSLDASQLISELEQLAGKKRGISLPSVQQLFTIGGLLCRIGKQKLEWDLPSAYQHLIDSLPESYLRRAFLTYHKATTMVLEQSLQSQSLEDLAHTTEALSGLLSNSPRLCQIAYSNDWMSLLASIYDRFVLKDASSQQKQVVLSAVSFLLLDGLFLIKRQGPIEEQVLNLIQSIEKQSTDCLRDLQEWQSLSEPFRRTLESCIQKLPATNNDDDDSIQQREYILNMLESARQREATPTTISSHNGDKPRASQLPAPKPVSAADEVERRIQQVKQILPDLGEGFIEAALSLNQGNVEMTVSILLNDPSQYPTALRVLDQSLPRRRKYRSKEEAKESVEARQIVKERVALEAQQEQERYKALLYVAKQQEEVVERVISMKNEYDDDYDDQYDELDVKLGGADDGLYDYEQVKLYNQVMRQDEATDSFWEENRNTNRGASKASVNNASENKEKQYRGPDKIKGGRIVGPDGKIVKKQGPGKRNNNTGSQTQQQQGVGGNDGGSNQSQQKKGGKPQQQQGAGGNDGSSKQSSQQKKGGKPQQQQGAGGNDVGSDQSSQQKKGGKPRTKPKSDNRINRQRDRKQKSQGTFGSQA